MSLLAKYLTIRETKATDDKYAVHVVAPVEVVERINEPQGHLESKDRIADDSREQGHAPKKQMGNRTPLEIIAKILAGKGKE